MKNKDEIIKSEIIIVSLFYFLVFILFLIIALFFKEYYWYYVIGVAIISGIVLTLYKARNKQVSSFN